MTYSKTLTRLIFLSLALATSCQNGQRGTGLGNPGTGDFGSFGGSRSPNSLPGGLDSGMLDNLPVENEKQAQAVKKAKDALGDLEDSQGDLFSDLENGSSDAISSFDRYIKALRALASIADLLRDAGYGSLADVFDGVSTLVPVFRYYNASIQKHFYTEDAAEGVTAESYGWGFDKLAFNLFEEKISDCSVPLYRCLWTPNGDYFLTTTLACGTGQNAQKLMGYMCPTQRARAPLVLTELVNNNATQANVHHFSTIDPQERDTVIGHGMVFVANLGFPPLY